jgi:hypothetical protein
MVSIRARAQQSSSGSVSATSRPKPEPRFSELPPKAAAEGNADGDDESEDVSLDAVEGNDAVDAVVGGFDVVPASEPEPLPEPPVIATNPDDAVAQVDIPDTSSFDITTPDAPDMSGVFETMTGDDGGGWDAGGGTDPSYDEAF